MHIKQKGNATLCSKPSTVVPLLKTKKPKLMHCYVLTLVSLFIPLGALH